MIDKQSRIILESLLTGVFIVDAKTREILDLNQAAADMIGYSIKEVIGMHCYKNVCQHDRSQCPVMDLGKTVDRTETTLIRKDGSIIPILKIAKRITIDEHDCILESFVDITEQKKMEKALRLREEESRKDSEFLNTVINSVPHPFYVIDPVDYSIVMANDASGYDAASGENTCHALTHKSDSPCSSKEHPCPLIEVKKTNQSFVTKHTHYDKDGNPRIYEVHGSPIFDQDGTLVNMIEFSIDITERREAMAALVESETMLRAMSDQAPIGIAVTDSTGNIIRVAGTWLDIFGMSKVEDSLGVNLFAGPMIPEAKMHELMKGNSISYESMYDFAWTHAAGAYECSRTGVIHLGTAITPLRIDEKARIEQYLVMVQDITELKKKENALRNSETFLKATGQMAKVGGWEVDAITNKVSWTEETYRIHEVPLDQKPLLEDAINFFHPDERERLSTAIQRALDHGEPYDMELRFITAKGKELWTRTICEPVVVDGKTLKLLGTFQDITERRLSEELLKESEERSRLLMEATFDGILIHDNFKILELNQKIADILGHEQSALIGENLLEVLPIESRKRIEEYVSKNQSHPYELKLDRDDGSFTIVEIVGKLCKYKGKMVRMAAVKDITERKYAEISLKNSEERYRRFIDVLPEGVIIGDTKENIMLANRAMGRILGIDSDELIGRNLMDFVDPQYRSQITAQNRRRTSGSSSEYDIRIRRADGELRDVHISATPHLNDQYEVEGAIGVISDITKQKKLEKDLRAASYELRERIKEIKAVSSALDLMKNIDTPLDTVFKDVLPILCAGFQFPEITCGRLIVNEHEFSTSNYNNPLETISEEIWVSGTNLGSIEIGYLELRPESDYGPFLAEELSLISQVTVELSQFIERQRAQQEITLQSAKLNAVTYSALDAIIMIDSKAMVQFWNRASERIFGYSEKEILGRNLHEIITPPKYMDAHREGFEKFIKTGEGAAIGKAIELSGLRKDGSVFPIELALAAIKLGDEWGSVGIVRDITEKVQSEQERLLQQKELEIYTSLLRHDLNNDLSGIVSSLEVVKMLMVEDPEEAQEFVDSSLALTVRMGNLLAAVSRTEKFQDESLKNMIHEIAKISADTEIGLEIQVIIDEEFKNNKILGGRLLPMVFENLFRNATQHAGETPKIIVEISTVENQARIVVSDDGPGVPDDIRNQLFERGITTKEGGGLGLHLSKKIVEAVGGSIELMPMKKGVGAQFEVLLPLAN